MKKMKGCLFWNQWRQDSTYGTDRDKIQLALQMKISNTAVEDAEIFLHDVLHVQSSCASGVLMGNALCENQDSAAEIVANLRAKIEQGKQELQLRYVYFCIGRGIDACRKK